MRCFLTLALAMVAFAAQAQTVVGVVRAGPPLPNVAVAVELDSRPLLTTGIDSKGQFTFSLPANTRPTSDLLMVFSAPGFAPVNRLISVRDAARPFEVTLLPSTGEGAITPAEKRLLEPAVTRLGTGPLVFIPYRLPAAGAVGTAVELNQRLRTQLQRLILTHVQRSLPDLDTRDITLAQLSIEAADDERLRAYGEFVNALAVVSGLGIADGSTQTIELASSFVIIPRTPQFQPPMLTIVDNVPAASIGRVALDQRLSKEWGRATVIALAVRDLRDAQGLAGEAKRAALRKTERLLVDELADVDATEQLNARRLQQLLQQVRKELLP